MKNNLLLLSALAIALVVIGCTITDPNTGEKVFDPIKTQQVKDSVVPGIATAVLFGLETEPRCLPGIELIRDTTCNLVGKGVVDPGTVNETLLALNFQIVPGVEGKRWSSMVVNTIISVYNVAVGEHTQGAVQRDLILYHILDALCTGIDRGLAQNATAVSGG